MRGREREERLPPAGQKAKDSSIYALSKDCPLGVLGRAEWGDLQLNRCLEWTGHNPKPPLCVSPSPAKMRRRGS